MIKKLRVTVDGNVYDVTVEMPEESSGTAGAAPTAAPVPVPAAPAPAAPPPTTAPPVAPTPARVGTGPGDVASPLAGRVTAIIVQPGQQVKENDHLLTLEAMKMNTFVFAPKGGKVAEVLVAIGSAVEEGQVLMKLA
ncbi:MAG: biotin/lipoyl-containing protein [Limisphaerales bacterium]